MTGPRSRAGAAIKLRIEDGDHTLLDVTLGGPDLASVAKRAIGRIRRLVGTVHRCPLLGSGLMPCCGRAPFEVPRTDRMTESPTGVTCGEGIL